MAAGLPGGGEGGAGRCPDWLRSRPLPAPRAPGQQPGSWFPLEGGRAGAGPVSQPRTRPRARGDKTRPAPPGNPGPAASGARRGGAGSDPLPAPPPLGPGSGSKAPRARARDGQSAQAVYLQQSNEESRGEATAAGRDVSCARGCCRRCGCLKLPKVASQREAAARRELKGKELVRCRSDRQTDAQTCRRHHRRRPIPGARKASQLRELLSGRVAC